MLILITKIVNFHKSHTKKEVKMLFFKGIIWLCCAGHLGLQLTCSSVDAASC